MLTNEDRAWIRSEMARSEERVHTRIRDGALSELRQNMDEKHRELGEMIGDVGRRVDQVDGEMKAFREEVGQRFDRLES